jgi:apolipoprotein D and lipocalin family protein
MGTFDQFMKFLFPFVVLFLWILMGTTSIQAQTLPTVAQVDLAQYAGKWYEIASYPMSFQRGCHCTTATYTVTDKDYVIVENRCNRDSVNGKLSYIKGKAFVTPNSGNSKLMVQFFWPFRAKYWIIDLAADYSFAVVSHPSKKYLWILSRTPKLDAVVYGGIVERLKALGFDLTKLKVTVQV